MTDKHPPEPQREEVPQAGVTDAAEPVVTIRAPSGDAPESTCARPRLIFTHRRRWGKAVTFKQYPDGECCS